MKHWLLLGVILSAVWLAWSGYFDQPFLLLLGFGSVAATVQLAVRMGIVDDEGTPLDYRFRPLSFGIWLGKEIVKSNIEVTRLILDPAMPIRPQMFKVKASQRTELGRVIFANSITLTPGTVSVGLDNNQIWVHALSFEGAAEDLSGEMARRVCALEATI